MQISDSVAIVTGANRGIGAEFARQLAARGARGVYAGTRDLAAGLPADLAALDNVTAIELDVTDPAQITRAAQQAGDVTLLVNNAGISTFSDLIGGDEANVARELDVHFWGTLRMIRAFAPVLAENDGGAIVNMLSALSWTQFRGATAYAAAKAAAWSLTDGARLELADQRTQVMGVFVGAVDTKMMERVEVPKTAPADVVSAALDGLERGADEVLADAGTVEVKRALALDPRERFPQLA